MADGDILLRSNGGTDGDISLATSSDVTINAVAGVLASAGNAATVTVQDGFEIERREDGSAWHFQAFDTASPYVDNSSLTVGVLYEYRVRQWTSGVAGSWSNISGLTFAASGQTINAAVGVMNAVGNTAAITSHSLVSAANGSMGMVGNTATISSGAMVNAAVGVMTLTGNTSTITSHSLVNAAVGSMGMVGNTATITSSGAEQTFSQDGVTYLLRDKFTSNVNPLVDANASEGAGVGYRDVTGTSFYASNGRLRGGNNSSEGKIVYKRDSGTAGWSRVGGRTFAALMTPDDADGALNLHFAETAGSLNGYGIRLSGKTFYCIDPDGTEITAIIPDGNESMKAIPYLVGITLNDTLGAVYWVSTDTAYTPQSDWQIPAYPDARILFVSTSGTFTTVHPTIRANSGFSYPGGVIVEDVRLFDIASWDGEDGMALVADRFNRADSSTTLGGSWNEDSGNWGISSNKAYTTDGGRATINTGVDDYWVIANIDIANTTDNFGLAIRRNPSDAGDYLSWDNNGSENIYFKRWLNPGGYQGGDYSTYMNWDPTTTVRMLVGADGNNFRAWFLGAGNGTVAQPFTPTDGTNLTAHTTGSYVGLFGSTNTRWDYFAAYPMRITLPSEFGKGAYPRRYSVSSVDTNNSTFTGSNGTALTSYTPVTGGNWSVDGGTWTIESNRAQGAGGSGNLRAYVQSNYTDLQVSTDVVMPSSFTQIRAGLTLRYADTNNLVQIRCFVDDVNQLNNDEIEVQEFIGGSGAVVHKCYLGNHYVASTTYNLKAHTVGDELYVFLDDVTMMRVILSNGALTTGTSVGLYREGGSDNATFDNFSVQRGGSLFIHASNPSLVATGNQATIDAPVTINANVGTLASSGNTATIRSDILINAAVGTGAFAGNTAIVTSHSLVSANVGSATFSGNTAAVSSHSLVSANVGALASAGNQASITSHSLVDANVGSAALIGNTATVTSHSLINAAVGVGTFVGNTASVGTGAAPQTVNANVGMLVSSGNTSTITSHSRVDAAVGIGTFAGNQASVSAGSSPQVINAAVGILVSSGNAAVITSHGLISANAGTLASSGNTAAITSHSLVNANAGTGSFVGNQATVVGDSRVACNPGTIISIGNVATIQLGSGPQTVNANAGLITAVGNMASVVGGPVSISANVGVLASVGLHADILVGDNPIVYVRINTLRRRQE